MTKTIRLAGAAALALTLAACGPHNLTRHEATTAESAGLKFAANLQADFIGCSGIDSEPDGYVTCTVKERATQRPREMVCSYEDDAGGCKLK